MKWVVVGLFVGVSAAARAEAPAPDPDPVIAQAGDPFSLDDDTRIGLSVGHHFEHAVVIERLTYLFEYWKGRFGVDFEWHGDRVFLRGLVFGIKVKAILTVGQSAVTAFALDPGWPWAAAGRRYAERKLTKYLHPTYDEP